MKGQDQHVISACISTAQAMKNTGETLAKSLACLRPPIPKTQPKPIYLCAELKKKEQLASKAHNKVLGKLMLSGSRVERPGCPNLSAI